MGAGSFGFIAMRMLRWALSVSWVLVLAISCEAQARRVGKQVSERAASLVGVRSLRQVSPKVPDDCTGLARLAYEPTGVNLMRGPAQRGDNGVTAIHRLARQSKALRRRASPGDLVFFRETYDRNRDGRRNDGLTHVGVVESVERDGTVVFVHRGHKGVSRSRMNLRSPRVHRRGEVVVNDFIRQKTGRQRGFLAGELFAGFASADVLATRSPGRK